MTKILNKIQNYTVLDSEIIQDVEYKKRKNSYFDINNTIYYWTLLMHAVDCEREELVEYLLEDFDVDVNYKDNDSYTALLLSCYNDDVPILKLLLGHMDINVNIQNNYVWTVLHEACYNNYIEYVKELLLDARVDVLIRTDQGETAQDIAIREGRSGIANMIKKTGHTSLLRIPNASLCRDITRMIIEEYT